jgi:DNA ligase-1
MRAFAALLDRLVLTPQRNVKLKLLTDYFRTTPDPDRGYALAALTGELNVAGVKPKMLRDLVVQRIDEELFYYSHDYVGDFAETIALIWPETRRSEVRQAKPGSAETGAGGLERPREAGVAPPAEAAFRGFGNVAQGGAERSGLIPLPGSLPRGGGATDPESDVDEPRLRDVVEPLLRASRLEGPRLVERWLDRLDATGRWALIKLVTGGLRIGVSARLAKQALADLAGKEVNEIEEVWHGIEPPYAELFAWLEGRGGRPAPKVVAPFRPVMLSHALADDELRLITPDAYAAEWKWDGIRLQAVREGNTARLYSRTGDDVSRAFPDLVDGLDFQGAIDGELLVGRKGASGFEVASFSDLQQRLNRKTVTTKHMESYPAFIRAYDCLVDEGEDLRTLPFASRRARLEKLVARSRSDRIDLSPLLPFAHGEDLAALRAAPPDPVIEGLMLKRWDSVYEPGRPKGPWFKWKRDPHTVDAVLMYAQRGHGKRSSYYSDYTFGVWRDGADGQELVPVGKAYFGFTDEELADIDRYVRNNTVSRFGPVREVVHDARRGLVLEVAFEGLQRSTRHKSGVAMRFPRIARLRWDKPPAEADTLETLEKLIRE